MLVVLMTGMSLAVDINISDEQGNLLHSYTVSETDSIDITVSTGTQPPPPPASAPTLTISPNSLPDGTESVSYSASVLMSAGGGTAPYRYSCYGTGLPGITTGNTARNNTCVISGVPAGSGPYSVTFRVDDDAGQSAQKSRNFTIVAASPPPSQGEPPGVQTITDGEILNRIIIRSGETLYYKFIIPRGSQGLQLSLSTWDWNTNQDMMLSQGLPYPTTDDYIGGTAVKYNGNIVNGSPKWSRISPRSSNETLYIYPNLSAGTYYVMVHNTSGLTGSFGLHVSYW
jgi:hypothetical protein